MGIENSVDIFQEVMTNLFVDLEFTSAHMDDVLIVSNGTCKDHLDKVRQALDRLQQANFCARVDKCFFAEDDLEHLGHQITRRSIQPQPKKVEVIQKIKPPSSVRQLRHFLGMVNHCRDVWKRRSHVLAPLTKLIGKGVKWVWDAPQQEAFKEIKRIMAKETMLAHPDFSEPFHVCTDASDVQLGAVIVQCPFCSRKLNAAQKNCTAGEQELSSTVETLEEFRTLLWGQETIVHADHKNMTCGNLSNDCIARWRSILEEHGPAFAHVKGVDDVVADASSRLEMKDGEQCVTHNDDKHDDQKGPCGLCCELICHGRVDLCP